MRSLLCIALCLSTSACAALVDTVYHTLDDQQFTRSSDASAPTGQTITRFEVAAQDPDGRGLVLSCFQRTRSVDRQWSAHKTYEYRGGYERSTYMGTSIVDGLFAALTAGVIAGICTNDDKDVSCTNMLWASPLAFSSLYGIIRYKTVGDPVLVDKQNGSDHMGISSRTIDEEERSCSELQSLWIGAARGPSDEQLLRSSSKDEQRVLEEGAQPVSMSAEGALVLSPESASYWATRSFARLWAVDATGTLVEVSVNRCTALRPFASTLTGEASQGYSKDCIPKTPQATQ